IGGMCHYMLPRRPRRKGWETEAPDGRYAEDAMKMFLAEIDRAGARARQFQAKLFGGGRMFDVAGYAGERPSIADTNAAFGREAIAQCGFRLTSEDLGGQGCRSVILDVWSGDVWVHHREPRGLPGRANG